VPAVRLSAPAAVQLAAAVLEQLVRSVQRHSRVRQWSAMPTAQPEILIEAGLVVSDRHRAAATAPRSAAVGAPVAAVLARPAVAQLDTADKPAAVVVVHPTVRKVRLLAAATAGRV
jgi:hypothetical protein